jgi:O-antigen ligase
LNQLKKKENRRPGKNASATPQEPAAVSGATPGTASRRGAIFAFVFGSLLGLMLLKFANPPIMEKWVSPPETFIEFALGHPWPLRWAYWLLAPIALFGAFLWRAQPRVPLAFALLPLSWFLWQLFAAANTVDGSLSAATVPHLGACVLCFYLGLYVLGRIERSQSFWIGIIGGLSLVILSGWQQHFGGLEETRKYFWIYVYPNLETIPVDYMKKISSDRIFATLFYPNSLAAAMILLLPAAFAVVYRWSGGGRFTPAARWFLALGITFAGLACLYWSGSKGGWLVMLFTAVLGYLLWPPRPQSSMAGPGIASRTKLLIVLGLVLAGLGGFFWTYSGFFKRGAPSVGARFDYWRGAVQTVIARPIQGTGPGTFAVPYKEVKAAESEMSRLVHNDYLQQASDSGIPGFLLYLAFIVYALWLARQNSKPAGFQDEERLVRFAVWLGLCGWALHSVMEFNLYVPALSWTAFALLGWLCAPRNGAHDRTPAPQNPGVAAGG